VARDAANAPLYLTSGPATRGAGELRELVHLLREAEHRLTDGLCDVLAAEAIGIEQSHVLSLLADGTTHPMRELAGYALLPASSATRLVDAMVRDGLVRRARDTQDRRLILVRISDLGRARHRRVAACIDTHRDLILASANVGALRYLAERLSAAVDQHRPPVARGHGSGPRSPARSERDPDVVQDPGARRPWPHVTRAHSPRESSSDAAMEAAGTLRPNRPPA
jgi:DNA-binding MarR family transcriptional regulator